MKKVNGMCTERGVNIKF